jgi:serine/threonine-protein kinase ULK2
MRHNNLIKIVDFGFSKILDNDSKMLGSPLNMAPEILNGDKYDNKADIWSVGTVFYELLFGKPPFVASNIIDLLKNIKSKKLEMDLRINAISTTCQDVLRRMLIVDPKERISWEELFQHQINFYQEENLKKELDKSFMTNNLSLSMSKFYIKNNVVIDHPSEIDKKKELNEFAIEQAKKK